MKHTAAVVISGITFLGICSVSHQFALPRPRQNRPETRFQSNKLADDVIVIASEVAERAARAAGVEILAGMGATVKNLKLNHKDIVTLVDGKCQELIRTEISRVFPDHLFLGEEDVPPGADAATMALSNALSTADWVWIVDPVDGTTNLAAGIPLVTTSIALAHRGVVVLGCVYDPSRDEFFEARKGRGATLNGVPMAARLRGTIKIEDSILCVGNPPKPSAFAHNLNVIRVLGPKVRGLRMFSSAALIFCWVAMGRLQAYIATDINAWDFAAGWLILLEVGGEATDHTGAPLELSTRNTICSAGTFHDDMVAEVNALGWNGK